MSDTVKLIIEIPKEVKADIDNGVIRQNIDKIYLALAHGTPLANDSERAEVQAYFYGQTYGWEQGRKALIEDAKAEFINSYPKNYMGEPELGGATCHFSLNKVLNILDRTDTAESEEQ